jgi:hypothetical protein
MVTPAGKRKAVAHLVEAHGMSERRACIFNATVVYVEYHKTPLWKVIGSILTTILLIVFGVARLRALL